MKCIFYNNNNFHIILFSTVVQLYEFDLCKIFVIIIIEEEIELLKIVLLNNNRDNIRRIDFS